MIDNEEGILKKAWYILLLISYGFFYFIYSIVEVLWKWAKEKFTK